jgi:hypothetical protein
MLAGVAFADDDDLVMGNYQGAFTSKEWQNTPLRVQVAATAKFKWRAVFFIGAEGGKEVRFEFKTGSKNGTAVEFAAENEVEILGGKYTMTARIVDQTLTGALKNKKKEQTFELKRVFVKPPTLGQAAPEGAIVLLDGTNTDQWQRWPLTWGLQGDGSMEVGGSNLATKQEFGDAQYHLEFMTPFKPAASGQERGNSGMYIQGRYEIQVLDSFADIPADNLCGGIYKKAVPLAAPSLPPLQWQTYDVTFTAPKFNDKGEKVKSARLTVLHNGVMIHDNLELDSPTPGGVSEKDAATGPLMLQDHNNPVRFRNIWVKPLK